MGIECSAKGYMNLLDVIFCAQRAVCFPIAPLFDAVKRKIKPGIYTFGLNLILYRIQESFIEDFPHVWQRQGRASRRLWAAGVSNVRFQGRTEKATHHSPEISSHQSGRKWRQRRIVEEGIKFWSIRRIIKTFDHKNETADVLDYPKIFPVWWQALDQEWASLRWVNNGWNPWVLQKCRGLSKWNQLSDFDIQPVQERTEE